MKRDLTGWPQPEIPPDDHGKAELMQRIADLEKDNDAKFEALKQAEAFIKKQDAYIDELEKEKEQRPPNHSQESTL